MIRYNSSNIFAGYIKELLHSFYLPSNKKYIDGYLDGKAILNKTKVLETNTLFYDSHTHEYLGDYLRFLRDEKKLDLMSLYNCFSNNIPTNISIESQNYRFSSKDASSVIYSIPVKKNKQYTIAIDSTQGVEILAGLYDERVIEFWGNSYKKISPTLFSTPFIYDTSTFSIPDDKEDICKIFLKLPATVTSSIVILEGNYLNGAELFIDTSIPEAHAQRSAKVVLNVEAAQADMQPEDNFWTSSSEVPWSSKCQLLQMNTGISHPFADRLIEYLLDNTITHLDNISENISLLQKKLSEMDLFKDNASAYAYLKQDGFWQDRYQDLLLAIALNNEATAEQNDLLGYVDKDVEKITIGSD